jgi:hypothetical protein
MWAAIRGPWPAPIWRPISKKKMAIPLCKDMASKFSAAGQADQPIGRPLDTRYWNSLRINWLLWLAIDKD